VQQWAVKLELVNAGAVLVVVTTKGVPHDDPRARGHEDEKPEG
jgi:hypothetical protein